MSEEGPRRGDPLVEIKGAAFLPYMVMEDISEKLKLLNYEEEFVSRRGQRPIPRLLLTIQFIICYLLTFFVLLVVYGIHDTERKKTSI